MVRKFNRLEYQHLRISRNENISRAPPDTGLLPTDKQLTAVDTVQIQATVQHSLTQLKQAC